MDWALRALAATTEPELPQADPPARPARALHGWMAAPDALLESVARRWANATTPNPLDAALAGTAPLDAAPHHPTAPDTAAAGTLPPDRTAAETAPLPERDDPDARGHTDGHDTWEPPDEHDAWSVAAPITCRDGGAAITYG